jgi:hypothetical protein
LREIHGIWGASPMRPGESAYLHTPNHVSHIHQAR